MLFTDSTRRLVAALLDPVRGAVERGLAGSGLALGDGETELVETTARAPVWAASASPREHLADASSMHPRDEVRATPARGADAVSTGRIDAFREAGQSSPELDATIPALATRSLVSSHASQPASRGLLAESSHGFGSEPAPMHSVDGPVVRPVVTRDDEPVTASRPPIVDSALRSTAIADVHEQSSAAPESSHSIDKRPVTEQSAAAPGSSHSIDKRPVTEQSAAAPGSSHSIEKRPVTVRPLAPESPHSAEPRVAAPVRPVAAESSHPLDQRPIAVPVHPAAPETSRSAAPRPVAAAYEPPVGAGSSHVSLAVPVHTVVSESSDPGSRPFTASEFSDSPEPRQFALESPHPAESRPVHSVVASPGVPVHAALPTSPGVPVRARTTEPAFQEPAPLRRADAAVAGQVDHAMRKVLDDAAALTDAALRAPDEPRVANNFAVHVQLGAAVDPDALGAALVDMLREAARRHGLEV